MSMQAGAEPSRFHRSLIALSVVGALVGFIPLPACASPNGERALDPKEVRGWLLRIHEAASRRNFQGTFVVSSSGSVSSARIAHYNDGPNQFERIESLDGQARQVYRHNQVVHTLWPQSRVALIEERGLLTSFPALLTQSDDQITDHYELRLQGRDRVAGHEADVLVLQPRDAWRFGYRLWADTATGLLLRSEVIGERGEVIETSAFSDVAIGVRPQADAVLQPMRKLAGYKVVRASFTPTRLEAEGWTLKQPVSGFKQVDCVRRPMAGADGEAPSEGPPVLQAIFSDGLTYVSLFIEPFSPQRRVQPGETALGATRTLMQRQGDWWLTIVGDVPAATLRAFAAELQRRK